MLIRIFKNWYDDAPVHGLSSMENFMNMKKTLTNENDEIFASLGPLEVQDNNNRP
jgi:hypothetical protein